MRIKLHSLLNESTYKLFSVKGLENIIRNFITDEAYYMIVGETAKDKAENLFNHLRIIKEQEESDKKLKKLVVLKKGRSHDSILKK